MVITFEPPLRKGAAIKQGLKRTRITRIKRIYMKTIKINPDETGWVKIDGSVRTIVAHFKDGHKETFSLVDFLTFKRRNLVVQIDCYEEGEEIKED